MAYTVFWPQTFNAWHREGLTSFGEPLAANAGAIRSGQTVGIPPKPVVSGGVTYVVTTMTSVRPRPGLG